MFKKNISQIWSDISSVKKYDANVFSDVHGCKKFVGANWVDFFVTNAMTFYKQNVDATYSVFNNVATINMTRVYETSNQAGVISNFDLLSGDNVAISFSYANPSPSLTRGCYIYDGDVRKYLSTSPVTTTESFVSNGGKLKIFIDSGIPETVNMTLVINSVRINGELIKII